MLLKVTNNGSNEFAARFDGKLYAFLPKKPVALDVEAAQHIFSLGLDDKTPTLVRYGWLHAGTTKEAAMAILDSFSFDAPDDDLQEHVEVSFGKPEGDNEQGSAPLQSEAGAESELPDGGSGEASATDSSEEEKGGSLLDNIPSFTGR